MTTGIVVKGILLGIMLCGCVQIKYRWYMHNLSTSHNNSNNKLFLSFSDGCQTFSKRCGESQLCKVTGKGMPKCVCNPHCSEHKLAYKGNLKIKFIDKKWDFKFIEFSTQVQFCQNSMSINSFLQRILVSHSDLH